MKLVHFTSSLRLDRGLSLTRRYTQGITGRTDKPLGLWVSDESGDDGWKNWCESEGFRPERLELAIEVKLKENSRILHIKSVSEIDDFHNTYSTGEGFNIGIDWVKVAKQYQGIVISPYQYRRRLDGDVRRWYYGWDCASGCIWDLKAIKTLQHVEQ